MPEDIYHLDLDFRLPVYSPICTFCLHYQPEALGRTCAPFPTTIPDQIWLGEFDHRWPWTTPPVDQPIEF